MIPFFIDGQPVEGKEGGNILEVALDAGFDIPNLCYNESVKPYGACRLCLVEIVRKGKENDDDCLQLSCQWKGLRF